MLDVSVHPNTLDEVEFSILQWYEDVSKGQQAPIRFYRAPSSSNRLSLVPKPESDVKFELRDQCVLIQVKQCRLTMNLDKFQITTAFKDRRLRLEIERHPTPEYRFLTSVLKQVAGTKHPVFVSRLLRVVQTLEEDLSNTRIDEVASAATDYDAILEALHASPRIGRLISEDPFAAAKMRGLKRKQQMMEQAGGTLSSEGVADVLGITRQAIDKRRAANQLLALTQGKRGYVYPRFQFDEGRTLQGLQEVLEEIKTLDSWMQLIFFTTANERLEGMTPIDYLREGDVARVVQAARGYGDQGAA